MCGRAVTVTAPVPRVGPDIHWQGEAGRGHHQQAFHLGYPLAHGIATGCAQG
jgi:hypothetical protein